MKLHIMINKRIFSWPILVKMQLKVAQLYKLVKRSIIIKENQKMKWKISNDKIILHNTEHGCAIFVCGSYTCNRS